MKQTGITRKIDGLGRVVLPVELRRTLDINNSDELDIYTDDNKIVLKKQTLDMTCQVTGHKSDDNLVLANGSIVLSPEGAEQLMTEIQARLNQ
ncbi:transition state genes transcriptional regulator AbrB [Barrientosiimonas marina]|uniref:AbrB/MazE/SpoVT family DNA-binding domain-containing protein n=1 Tax=Lentibacillus kimchii TaxID=1542911 RepID=A0ABW2UTX3_9BACI